MRCFVWLQPPSEDDELIIEQQPGETNVLIRISDFVSFSVNLSTCLCVCVPARPAYVCICLPMCLSVCLLMCLSACLCVCQPAHVSGVLCIWLPLTCSLTCICAGVSVSVFLWFFMSHSVCLSVCLPICLSVSSIIYNFIRCNWLLYEICIFSIVYRSFIYSRIFCLNSWSMFFIILILQLFCRKTWPDCSGKTTHWIFPTSKMHASVASRWPTQARKSSAATYWWFHSQLSSGQAAFPTTHGRGERKLRGHKVRTRAAGWPGTTGEDPAGTGCVSWVGAVIFWNALHELLVRVNISGP